MLYFLQRFKKPLSLFFWEGASNLIPLLKLGKWNCLFEIKKHTPSDTRKATVQS